jgi:hypothetical protein
MPSPIQDASDPCRHSDEETAVFVMPHLRLFVLFVFHNDAIRVVLGRVCKLFHVAERSDRLADREPGTSHCILQSLTGATHAPTGAPCATAFKKLPHFTSFL